MHEDSSSTPRWQVAAGSKDEIWATHPLGERQAPPQRIVATQAKLVLLYAWDNLDGVISLDDAEEITEHVGIMARDLLVLLNHMTELGLLRRTES